MMSLLFAIAYTIYIVMRQKKVILIRNAQPYDFGGGERFPVFVAKVLKRDHGVPIIISSSPSLLKYAQDAEVQTIRGLWWSNQDWSGVRALLFPVYVAWQVILLAWYVFTFVRIRPSVIHIQSKDDFIAATIAGRLTGAVVIWTDHADIKHIWQNLGTWYKNPVGKLVYVAAHFTHAITVISKSEYREVTKHLSRRSNIRKRIQIINNGSPDVKNNYTESHSNIFTFSSTNRLVTDKGIGEMIAAYQRFHKKYPSSQLILVGNGPEEDSFRELASDDSSIVFTGYQADPLSFVASSHVLLQPTYHEGFSISILEAQMLQKPVIATAIGGNVEMIEDRNTGILIPVRDTDALFKAMELLYKNKELRERVATNGRKQYVEKYIFDDIVRKGYIKLYEKSTN